MAEAKDPRTDPRFLWVYRRVASSLTEPRYAEKLKINFFNDENIMALVKQFLEDGALQTLFVTGGGEKVAVATNPPKQIKKKSVLFLKPNKIAINKPEQVDKELLSVDLSSGPLDQLSLIANEIFMPILSDPNCRESWSETIQHDIMDKTHSFLSNLYVMIGNTKGETLLPLPPEQAYAGDPSVNKERIHMLESAIIRWSKQINSILRTDPEAMLNSGLDPDPLIELEFWIAKARNLNSIYAQLESDKMKTILAFLAKSENAFGAQFSKLTADVLAARAEANENARFLNTGRPLFLKLNDTPEFEQITHLFRPIFHTVLLIWKSSKTYNTNARLVCLVRELCNALIRAALNFVNGEKIFEAIEQNVQGEALQKLQAALKVMFDFKDMFHEYQKRAVAEIGPDAWSPAEKSLFLRLDMFVERCQDLIEMLRIVVDFAKLEKIYLGNTKGAALTKTLRDIHAEFLTALATFRAAPYDVMDVRVAAFDEHFHAFRETIKLLEPRLAQTILSAFDDCPTVTACFKLLESFESLLERKIVADALEWKYTYLVQAYEKDIQAVSELFHAIRRAPPVHSNMPPISGALSWSRALSERVRQPMEYMLTQPVFHERAGFGDVKRAHDTCLAMLAAYESQKVKEWSAETEVSSQAKLKQPLLRRDDQTHLLDVNFDKAVTRLLREVKYFLQLKLPVNDTALSIYHQEQTFRNHKGNLDLVVSMYNEMLTTLSSVERPLVEAELSAIDQNLNAGLHEHNWQSPDIATYISELLEMVRAVYNTVKTMKNNLKEIERVIKACAAKPLIARKVKPVTAKDFNETHAKLVATRRKEIADDGEAFARILAETARALAVDVASPNWQNYVGHVQSVVIEGLAQVLAQNLTFLADQIDPAAIAKNQTGPLLTINLSLAGKEVCFLPFEDAELKGGEVPQSGADVWAMVQQWADSFFGCLQVVKRLDQKDGAADYMAELHQHANIKAVQTRLAALIADSRAVAEKHRADFLKYKYLYQNDIQVAFAEYMRNKLAAVKSADASASAGADHHENKAGEGEEDFGAVPLADIDGQIVMYKTVQSEIVEKHSPIECGWLRINTQPIKSSLSTWVGHWIHKYIAHLQGEVITKIRQLNEFMVQVKEGTKEAVPEGDTNRLREVLSYIHAIRTKEKQIHWEPFREMVTLLKKHGFPLDESEIKVLNDTPQKWENTVQDILAVQQSITQAQNAEVDNIKRRVEEFTRELEAFRVKFRKEGPFDWRDGTEGIMSAYRQVYKFNASLDALQSRAVELRELEQLFELNVSGFRDISLCRQENKFLKTLWDMISIVFSLFESWKQTLWDAIDTEQLLAECKDLKQQIDDMPREMKSWKAYIGVQDQVKNLMLVLPLVNILHSPSMQPRHWEELASVIHKKFEVGPSFCMADLLVLELHKHVEDVEDIVEKSNKESKIEAQLKKIRDVWKVLALEFVQHKASDVKVIRVPEEVNQALEEHMVLLQGIQNQGKYVKFFEKTVALWMSNLGAVETVLRDWFEVQGKWASLETIFLGSADIRVQLPEDSKRFDTIDQDFRALMVEAANTPNVVESCTKQGRSALLEMLKSKLELCEKSLNNYLEAKKKIFPRFYFLSDVALLDILSNGNNPQKIQKHLADCFDNLQTLKFIDGPDGQPTKRALGMYSKDGGEYVEFKEPFNCEGAVEDWLNGLVDCMRVTLRDILGRSKEAADLWSPEAPRTSWLYEYCAQIVVTTSQLMWTEEMNQAFDLLNANENAMRECVQKQNAQLDALISLVQGDLSSSDRTKIITLITIDVHSRDVTQSIIDQKIDNPLAFQWLSQLRYFWTDRNCILRICDAEFFYAFEYIGNPGRLVITPLTDRCYITLTQALRLIMGGAPAGPAGTGKTETTKDLGRGMALPVYVFNCSSQMNIYTLGDIFKGLCQTGGWGCFDEFNRIPIEVLSVVSTQYMTILQGLRAKASRIDFMGDNIRLISTMGAFITMNPGYAGRTELPESLKALFRPCAMVVPDFEMICENMLMSEGFLQARPLAKKIVTLYRLGSDLLSKQAQYDWGLRAIKSVLRVAGGLKRAERQVPEDGIMMRALRDFNLPKIVDDDKTIFKRIISDLFPGLELAAKVDLKFNEWVRKCAVHSKMQPEDMFVNKVVSLKELLEIRHSVFIIGPAGCGKSVVWKTLIDVYNTIERGGLEGSGPKTAVFDIMNPKAVTSDELFGWKTAEWHDGVLSVIMRDMSRNNAPYTPNQKVKWCLLDGDIDPEWIESLNTVMDDNKVLTLVSNERIPLTPAMRMVFEISHLKYATPATVSRAGILFISDRDVGWKPFMESWIDAREDEKEKSVLLLLFNRYVKNNDVIEKVRREFKFVVPVSEIQLVQVICRSLEFFSDQIKAARQSDWTAAFEKEVWECAFVFSVIWAYGGPLLVDKGKNWRDEFSQWWKREFPAPVKFDSGSVFDYFPDLKTGKMTSWAVRLPKYVPGGEADLLVSNIYVPTIDTYRLTYLLDLFAKNRRPVAFVGNAGTGKTTIMREYLQSLSVDDYLCATINFNSFTDSYALQLTMEQYIDKRSGRTFGPPPGKRLIYFIDDLNMPYVDKYGTQSPIELLVQHINYGSFYDRKRLDLKKEVKDAQYVACMNPTAGSFFVNDRLMRHFACFSCIMPSVSDVKIIFKSILDDHFRQMDGTIQAMSEKLVAASVDVLQIVSEKFLPNSEKFMYQFNLRELCNIMQGICMSSNAKYAGNRDRMVRLWAHECMRVFSDRFIIESDVELFKKLFTEKMAKHFDDVKIDLNQVLLFTSFVSDVPPKPVAAGAPPAAPPANAGPNGYVPVPNFQILKDVLTDKLELYNDSNPNMDLVLFEMAMEHICRIARIINIPRGNALLVGVGGSGKQSLARLASFICGYKVYQIAVTATYGMNDFKGFLQDLYQRCAIKSEQLAFMLTDTQIVDERFLVYVNDLLSSGFIPDLFNNDERESIFQAMRKEFVENRVPEIKSRMNDFFVNKVRSNLHVILCFSPVGDAFRVRARKFPALVNCTSMDFFHGWPRQALETVALRFLQKIDIPDELRPAVSLHMAEVHTSVIAASALYRKQERRYNYATPKSFLELINFYQVLLEIKRGEVNKKKDRLEKGLNILRNTAADVARLKEDLVLRLAQVEDKKASAAKLIVQIGQERAKVEKQQALAAIEAEKSSVIAQEASALKAECEAILGSALPVMKAAKEAVDALDKNSLVNLAALKSPPEAVSLVTRAVLMLREGKKKSDWKDAQKMLKGVDKFLQELKAFGPEQVLEPNVEMLKEIFDMPVFNPDAMMAVSSAAANLCAWVLNIVAYWKVWKDTVPKQNAMAAATAQFENAQAKLAAVQAKVEEMERALQALNDGLEKAMAEQAAVELEAKQCVDRLALAERLVGGLADENTRWGANVADLNQKLQNLTGDVLLGAAFVSYIGAFNSAFRSMLWQQKWLPDLLNRKIPLTDQIDPLGVLASDSNIAKWKNEGLPADRISIENGAIVNNCQRWPLMIDPQLQGLKWIKQRSQNLRPVAIGAKQWLTIISQAIQNGDVVLIENIGETLDAVLDPILARAFVKRGRTLNIKIGDDEVEFNPKFKLYLQTKLINPHYKPEIAAQCTLINFIVTEEGLEDQLLAMVVNREKPELEEKRTKLVMSINQLNISLVDLESDLLEKLSNAPDDILSDISLIEGLERTKAAAKDIEAQMAEAKIQEVAIDKARNAYRAVAADGSWIYFLLIQLSSIEYMYQYSLDAFTFFFFKAMDRTQQVPSTEERVQLLIDMIRVVIFTWVSRGLFERHKLVLSSQLCFKLMRKGVLPRKLDLRMFEFMLLFPKKVGVENPIDWLPKDNWNAIQKMAEIETFNQLPKDMEASPNRFKDWFNAARPEATPLPLDWRKLDDQNPFAKLLVLRSLRPDRMVPAITDFVRSTLPRGERFTECDSSLSFADVLDATLADSSPITPIFFILSSGADPMVEVVKLAQRQGFFNGRYWNVSMGQGQDKVAMKCLEEGHRHGHWVVLQNIHLMPRWTLELEKRLDEYAVEGSHPDFRVFLSAEPSDGIPIGILERSIKLTNEPPQGLKANVKRAFATLPRDEFEFKDNKVKCILFALCHFHAVVLERKKFGSGGWNRQYPFSSGDLVDSATVLFNYLDNAGDKVPWDDLRYIFGEIMYGGHVTDDWDRRLVRNYLKFYMKEDLFDEMDLFPFSESFEEHFRAPPVMAYPQYLEYIDRELAFDTPVAFGMHPNAEIGVKTDQANTLFQLLIELQPRGGGGESGGDGADAAASSTTSKLEGILEHVKRVMEINIDTDLNIGEDDKGPFQNVFLQEITRMNDLIREIARSIRELELGLNGELTMSPAMESLQNALLLYRVPERWSQLAYPSMRSLGGWLSNLEDRAKQLMDWTREPTNIPLVTNISYLFNPQSFLTAIMQTTSQKYKLELDKLFIVTDVTRKTVSEIDAPPREGAYITGLSLEGARWDKEAGVLAESNPKELFCEMPVINCKALLADKKEKSDLYDCPVYKTQQRGPTFVTTAQLKTKADSTKWVLAGVVMILDRE